MRDFSGLLKKMHGNGLGIFIITSLAMVYAQGEHHTADTGSPAGLIPDCPGVLKNSSISGRMMQNLQIMVLRITANGKIEKRIMPILATAKMLTREKFFDFQNRKTVFYSVGYLDTTYFPHTQAIGNTYLRRGYNVIASETFAFFTIIYPRAARISRVIGKKIGEFLVKLYELGLSPDDLELVGTSLGAHVVSYAAKHLYAVTGHKPRRLTGIDPAGPCFRNMPPSEKFHKADAHHVDVIHTNIDGFGTAQTLGHVDFYANGGEYQPSDIPYLPCLIICSHIRAIIYWWQALEHPKGFIGIKCESVQDARLANCYNGTETNYFGLETNFNRSGIYYLPTNNEFPYFRGREGLKAENEIYTSVSRQINYDDNFVI